jgi:hypothetical protein
MPVCPVFAAGLDGKCGTGEQRPQGGLDSEAKSCVKITLDDRFQETDPQGGQRRSLRRAHQNLSAQSAVLILPVGAAQVRLCPPYRIRRRSRRDRISLTPGTGHSAL